MTETNLKIEQEVIDDLYYQLGCNPPKEITQKTLEENLIKRSYMMGYNEAKSKFATVYPPEALKVINKIQNTMTEKQQPKMLEDYSICEFLDRDTWKIKYQVNKQPIEDHPYFECPVFDTWEEAVACVRRLREYPKYYLSTESGVWMEVENV